MPLFDCVFGIISQRTRIIFHVVRILVQYRSQVELDPADLGGLHTWPVDLGGEGI